MGKVKREEEKEFLGTPSMQKIELNTVRSSFLCSALLKWDQPYDGNITTSFESF